MKKPLSVSEKLDKALAKPMGKKAPNWRKKKKIDPALKYFSAWPGGSRGIK